MCSFYKDPKRKLNLAFPYQWEFYPVNRLLAETPSPVINSFTHSFTQHISTEHLLDVKVPALKKPRFWQRKI